MLRLYHADCAKHLVLHTVIIDPGYGFQYARPSTPEAGQLRSGT